VLVVDREELAGRVSALLAAGQRVAVLAPAPVPVLPADAIVLDAPEDADAYAHVLYARLREVDRRGVDALLAVAPPASGVGAAVRDRLWRAAGREQQ
jgi:L-threonylcarbamoyladenylate synthase